MDLKMKVMAATAEILKAYTDESDERPWSVSYSGGKDSTVTLAVTIRAIMMLPPERRRRKIFVTSANTKLDLTTDPTKYRELKSIQGLIEKYQLPMEIAEVKTKPNREFVFLVLGKGYALPKNSKRDRWCTSVLKIDPQELFMKKLNPVLTLLGVRMSETDSRAASIKSVQVSQYYGERTDKKGIVVGKTLMPVVEFTLENIWNYLAEQKTPWGDAEEISQLYKDATGECGLSRRKAGGGEKADDPCGARFGCIICPVVTIDKSTREISKKKPWFEPYAELRDVMVEMYQEPENRSGYRRNGMKLWYGKGAFTIKARMKLFEKFMQAQEDNRRLALMHSVEPQPIIDSEMIEKIQLQWAEDLNKRPYLEDAEEIGMIYEERVVGSIGILAFNFRGLLKKT